MSTAVLVVDDHEVARIGIALLAGDWGITVVGSVASGTEAIGVLADTHVDIVLLDARLQGEDGLASMQKIRKSRDEIPVVIFSAYDNPTYIARAAALGAYDYVLKSGASAELHQALERAGNGHPPSSESRLVEVRAMMREEVDASSLPPELPLTSREAQVLRHMALGLSNKEIASSLSISVETVKEHVQNILRKMNANDRTDAAVRAIKSGFVT